MDLIYANQEKRDIGILNSYSFDMAIGDDENDFACTIDTDDHCCQAGYYLYIEDTEYGGIIDSIKVSTANKEITYSGRTWHGVLENKVICPPRGQDYAEFQGEANLVLAEIMQMLDLTDLFEVPAINSGIEILPYQMERYAAGYTSIRKMLRENDAKLKLYWRNGKVIIQAVHRYDYSQDDEFNTAQVDFDLERIYKPCNHLICLGQGDLKQRAVIHLFTDENGGVQPYTLQEEPLMDSHYILDESKKLLFGENEISDVLDMSNAEITTNYILLESKPVDWDDNCEAYFYRTETNDDEDGEIEFDYSSVSREAEDLYTLQRCAPADWSVNYPEYFIQNDDGSFSAVSSVTTYSVQSKKPSDWSTNYKDYFYKSGSDYRSVESIENDKYTKQSKKPSDWKKNYSNYFIYYSDGVTSEYRSVSGIQKHKYVKQTQKPTDWEDNYKSYFKKKKTGGYQSLEATGAPTFKTNKYYKKKSDGRYELLKKKPSDWSTKYSSYYTKKNSHYYAVEETTAPPWKKNKYFTKQEYSIAPKWVKNTYYTESTTVKIPTWQASKYYTKNDDSPPAWAKNKYYTKSVITPAPEFARNTYYYAVEDRYAVLVENGLSKLEEAWKADQLSIDLAETDQAYDIDDIVGASEPVTGMETIQNVSKKIIIISNDDITITYEVS